MAVSYEYPRPALTVDAVVFGLDDEDPEVLLIRRGLEPFPGKWALPGGFVRVDEALEDAVRRELQEETGISQAFLEQLYAIRGADRRATAIGLPDDSDAHLPRMGISVEANETEP